MAIEQELVTAEDMLAMPDDGMRWELIDGEIQRMPPPGAEHEETAGEVLARFREHVKARTLGRVYGAPGVIVRRNPDRVRAPDFAFVSGGRLPEGKSPTGYLQEAPDLVVEVVSPTETATDLQAKIQEWLDAGVRLAIALYPKTRTAAVYRSASDIRLLSVDDMLDCGDVVDGFTCRVGDLFPR